MHLLDEGFEPPEACMQWCGARAYPLHVLDDGVQVDLNWWNHHLRESKHEIVLHGRDLDGRVVNRGTAIVQRNDLRLDSELFDADHNGLGLLFLCAAWRSAHPNRRATRRLPDVFDAYTPKDPLRKIKLILDHCATARTLPPASSSNWSGWPDTPGVGVSLMAVYLWAVGVTREGIRAQMIDQHGVSTLIHEGWLEEPSVSGFTLRRYDRYQELLRTWSIQARTHPELIEMWLVQRWNARVQEARSGARAEPTLF
ncbi:8-oxoguanine DNA glycosylase OGG fold protein [Rhodococcus sp. W8901]|uniref:8-oxoguanine DNA glycosylase OGG fold protein n=1 Tax=Rhodococcus sp. W8901 TaxID=2742603 RepID=UPI001582AA84|nr:hypothetical protein [Rhodococcus sp. W8901]QKT10930.1 hypothetical protein HUN07_09570 [Rhodococcus sp. W8901]